MFEQPPDGVGDQGGRRLVATHQQLIDDAEDFLIGQPLAVLLRLHQAIDQITPARRGTAFANPGECVVGQLGELRLVSRWVRRAHCRHRSIRPALEQMLVASRNSQHFRDNDNRQRKGEDIMQIPLTPRSLVEQFIRQRLDPAAHGLDGAG